jgi:hypothetical protein
LALPGAVSREECVRRRQIRAAPTTTKGDARWLGIIMVSIQAVTNFVFIPVPPFWAITLIVVDLWVIHSLFVHRRKTV